MTWNDAAERILQNKGKSINYKTLAQEIIKAKMVETESKTPHITLHASIMLENKSREDRGIPLRFSVERGEIGLTAWRQPDSQTTFLQQATKLRNTAKTDLLKKLTQLSGDKFESFLEALLVKMGYEDVELRGGPHDEGIDLLCQMAQGINQVKTAVQAKCKQATRKVGPKDVRLLRDVLPKFQCSQGVLITTTKFTREATEAANEEGRLPIILIDGDKLSELALEHEVSVKAHLVKTYSLDKEFELFQSGKQS
jgi:restriction endonuclease Mrr